MERRKSQKLSYLLMRSHEEPKQRGDLKLRCAKIATAPFETSSSFFHLSRSVNHSLANSPLTDIISATDIHTLPGDRKAQSIPYSILHHNTLTIKKIQTKHIYPTTRQSHGIPCFYTEYRALSGIMVFITLPSAYHTF